MSRASVSAIDLESARLAVLRSYAILDTPPEPEFDALVRQAAGELKAPVVVLSFMDATRAWFKAQVGLEADGIRELPRSLTFCEYAFGSSGTFVVPDAAADPRFASLPMVVRENGYRFYVGTPLRAPNGHSIGTLCLLDHAPRQPDARELAAVRAFGDQAMALLDLRRARRMQSASFPPYPGKTDPGAGAPHVLIVDDDEAVREFVCIAARQLGYIVTEATNGAEALGIVQNDPGIIELVLTDVNMPVMDGMELVRALQKLPAPPRIAAMSGRFDSQIRAGLRALGVAALLGKPFTMPELELALQQTRVPPA